MSSYPLHTASGNSRVDAEDMAVMVDRWVALHVDDKEKRPAANGAGLFS